MATDPLTVDFTQSPFRRGMIPTPAGALPLRKRTNRGMVSLAAWDAKVAADNVANGTSSESAPGAGVTLVQLLDTKQSEKALAEIAGKPLEPEAPANPVLPIPTVPIPVATPAPSLARATDPDDDDAVEIPTGGAPRQAMSRDALMEDGQSTRTNPVITLPTPAPEAVAAAKAALALEEAAAKAEQPGPPETPAAAIVAPTSTTPEPQAPPFIPPPPTARKTGNRR